MLLGKNKFIDNLILINNYKIEDKLIIEDNSIMLDTTYFQGIVRYYYDVGYINRKNIEKVLFNTYAYLFLLIEISCNYSDNLSYLKTNRLFTSILSSKDKLLLLSEKYNIESFNIYYQEMITKFYSIISYTNESVHVKMTIKKKKRVNKEIKESKKMDELYLTDNYSEVCKFCNDIVYKIVEETSL